MGGAVLSEPGSVSPAAGAPVLEGARRTLLPLPKVRPAASVSRYAGYIWGLLRDHNTV